jgi:hypothetical protein
VKEGTAEWKNTEGRKEGRRVEVGREGRKERGREGL